ncbi:MAG: FkbM family methyltransferase [Candidatus Magasanikbacteria bacterium GW2011_GWC2_41_17]|uniref:FkbM family methyltransferase n=2 Tax=Candidatus Magasanikiibacteriota TaxID=1752731 RepID=A0A0G0WLM0_9BACT|nr:MAG: FkbM family methyltransferase [Candidatus Magasanikbacteria bacterium GW2011_GWC2_41_17]KKS13654.1 MAG: FkbM family methyltransferase [Candidatus Magasanikbacteria bacterium GW2011_GWA2_41_55]
MKLKTLFTMKYSWAFRYCLKRLFIDIKYYLDFRKFIEVEVDGLKVKMTFAHPNHHYFVIRSKNKKYYEYNLFSIWKKHLPQTATDIIDFGGYNGFYGLLAAKACPASRIYIFEPDIVNYEHIKKNIIINDLRNVTVIKAIVTDKIRSVFFSELRGRETGRISDDSDFKIDCWILDEWLEKNNINPTLIKMDIEGAEYLAFSGMKDYLKTAKNINILLELHSDLIKKFGNTKENVLKLLSELGFKCEFLNKNHYGCEYYWVSK